MAKRGGVFKIDDEITSSPHRAVCRKNPTLPQRHFACVFRRHRRGRNMPRKGHRFDPGPCRRRFVAGYTHAATYWVALADALTVLREGCTECTEWAVHHLTDARGCGIAGQVRSQGKGVA